MSTEDKIYFGGMGVFFLVLVVAAIFASRT